jgi:hypothetical protein
MANIPTIQLSTQDTGIRYCTVCGFAGIGGVKSFDIKSGATGITTHVLCQTCSEKIALFLLRKWETDRTVQL